MSAFTHTHTHTQIFTIIISTVRYSTGCDINPPISRLKWRLPHTHTHKHCTQCLPTNTNKTQLWAQATCFTRSRKAPRGGEIANINILITTTECTSNVLSAGVKADVMWHERLANQRVRLNNLMPFFSQLDLLLFKLFDYSVLRHMAGSVWWVFFENDKSWFYSVMWGTISWHSGQCFYSPFWNIVFEKLDGNVKIKKVKSVKAINGRWKHLT